MNRSTKTDGYPEQQRLCRPNSDKNNSILITYGKKMRTIPSTPLLKKFTSFARSTSTTNRHSKRVSNSTAITVSELGSLSSHSVHNGRRRLPQQTTKMLVMCSTTFLLFNSPYCAVLFYSIISKVVLTRTLGILRHFYFMSFCLNFFLYALWGRRFRQELIRLLKTCCRRRCLENNRLQ